MIGLTKRIMGGTPLMSRNEFKWINDAIEMLEFADLQIRIHKGWCI